MSNRTDIVVETDNAEGQVLLSASRVYDLTEDKTQDTINDEIRNTLNQLGNDIATILQDPAQDTFTEGTYVVYNNQLYTVAAGSGGIPMGTSASSYYPSKLTAVSDGGLNSLKNSLKFQLLWTNPNPENSFTNQTVALGLSGYEFVFVQADQGSCYVKVGYGGSLVGNTYPNIKQRSFQVSTTGIYFSAGKRTSSGTDDNTACVPQYIYGII